MGVLLVSMKHKRNNDKDFLWAVDLFRQLRFVVYMQEPKHDIVSVQWTEKGCVMSYVSDGHVYVDAVTLSDSRIEPMLIAKLLNLAPERIQVSNTLLNKKGTVLLLLIFGNRLVCDADSSVTV